MSYFYSGKLGHGDTNRIFHPKVSFMITITKLNVVISATEKLRVHGFLRDTVGLVMIII